MRDIGSLEVAMDMARKREDRMDPIAGDGDKYCPSTVRETSYHHCFFVIAAAIAFYGGKWGIGYWHIGHQIKLLSWFDFLIWLLLRVFTGSACITPSKRSILEQFWSGMAA